MSKNMRLKNFLARKRARMAFSSTRGKSVAASTQRDRTLDQTQGTRGKERRAKRQKHGEQDAASSVASPSTLSFNASSLCLSLVLELAFLREASNEKTSRQCTYWYWFMARFQRSRGGRREREVAFSKTEKMQSNGVETLASALLFAARLSRSLSACSETRVIFTRSTRAWRDVQNLSRSSVVNRERKKRKKKKMKRAMQSCFFRHCLSLLFLLRSLPLSLFLSLSRGTSQSGALLPESKSVHSFGLIYIHSHLNLSSPAVAGSSAARAHLSPRPLAAATSSSRRRSCFSPLPPPFSPLSSPPPSSSPSSLLIPISLRATAAGRER